MRNFRFNLLGWTGLEETLYHLWYLHRLTLLIWRRQVALYNLLTCKLNGTWYEIGSIKGYFQQGLKNTTVQYEIQEDGSYKVTNKGFKADGSESGVQGTLSCPEKNEKSKLKLQVNSPLSLSDIQIHLFGLFSPTSDFWIIEVGPDFSYFVASGPKRGCWILSATPTMDDATYNEILERCKKQEIDISTVTKTEQNWPTN